MNNNIPVTCKIAVGLPLLAGLLGASTIKDPRKMEFPQHLELTPHEVTVCTLSNGIEVFFAQDHEVPVVDILFYLKVGENRVPADHAGLAEILADMVAEGGSKAVPRRQFIDSLEAFGASFRGNGESGGSYFTLHLLSRNVPDLLPMVAGVLREPVLPADLLEVSKGQYARSYQGRNTSPMNVGERVFQKLIYGEESPLAREVTPVCLKNITTGKLKQFHQANYRPGELMVGVVGDFDPQNMQETLEKYLGDWQEPSVKPWERLAEITDSLSPGVYYVDWPGAVQSSIHIGYLGLCRDDEGYPASRILSEVYGGSWTSRIFNQIREERGLAYLAHGWISSGYTVPGVFEAWCETGSGTTMEASKLIIDIIEDLRLEGITEDELIQARDSWLASFPSEYESPEGVLRKRMYYHMYGYPMDFSDGLPDKVEPLTQKDVNAFATKFLDKQKLIILVLGDSTAFDGSLSELGTVTVIDKEIY